MISKEEKDRRKSIRDALKRRERKDAEAKLPLPTPEMKQLFDWVDAKLQDEGCDHTLRHSVLFLRGRGIAEDGVIAWLEEEGGYCDCEVIANAEERWREIIGEI
jgi:uncharacterized protein DUF2695